MADVIPRFVTHLKARGKWRASYTPPNEKPVTRSTFTTKVAAQAWLDSEISDLLSGRRLEPEKAEVTFAEYAEEVFFPLNTVRETTDVGNQNDYEYYIAPYWGSVILSDIRLEHVEAWRKSLASTPLHRYPDRCMSASQQHKIYWLFHKMIATAIERSYIMRNPLPRKSGLPEKEQRVVEPLLPHEVSVLAEACGTYTDLVYLLAFGGLRISEACALRVNDLDREASQVRVDEQLRTVVGGGIVADKRLKRRRSRRVVPLAPDVMAMLVTRVDSQIGWDDPDAFIFRNTRTGQRAGTLRPINFRHRHFQPAAHSVGLGKLDGRKYEGITPHYLRHTAVSAWLDEGFQLAEIARFIGDSLQVTEDTYAHLFQSKLETASTRMNERMRQGQRDAEIIPIRKRRAS